MILKRDSGCLSLTRDAARMKTSWPFVHLSVRPYRSSHLQGRMSLHFQRNPRNRRLPCNLADSLQDTPPANILELAAGKCREWRKVGDQLLGKPASHEFHT